MVEGQHVVSTLRLVDSLEEQDVLEAVLEATKPKVPPECRHLHYLMFSPFRYGLYPYDSRFRRKGRTPGVFYAAEASETAAAETVWYRMRFFAASPGTPLPLRAAQYSAIACAVAAPLAVDLIGGPLAAEAEKWTDPDDYSHCLALADRARGAGAEAIRYASVRHPDALPNVAVLTCRAFALPEPQKAETWRIALSFGRAVALREFPRARVEFLAGPTRLAWGRRAAG
jgi:hypothetical protein